MDLRTYLLPMSASERTSFARRVGASPGYLSRISRHHGRPGQALCDRIVEETGGVITEQDLRPDWYGQPRHKPRGIRPGRPVDWLERRAMAEAEKTAAIRAMRERTARKVERRTRKIA